MYTIVRKRSNSSSLEFRSSRPTRSPIAVAQNSKVKFLEFEPNVLKNLARRSACATLLSCQPGASPSSNRAVKSVLALGLKCCALLCCDWVHLSTFAEVSQLLLLLVPPQNALQWSKAAPEGSGWSMLGSFFLVLANGLLFHA